MMEILSHRGWWKTPSEKNSMGAFRRAFAAGFGVETDVRDKGGRLVISHDVPTAEEPEFADFLSVYSSSGGATPLAINIKSDGLQNLLAEALAKYGVTNYFVFDMSVPELIRYRGAGLSFFTRLSDYEPQPYGLQWAKGVWVDGFDRDWSDMQMLEEIMKAGLSLAVVSPELHQRDKTDFWTVLREWHRGLAAPATGRVLICTDHPDEARRFFDEQG